MISDVTGLASSCKLAQAELGSPGISGHLIRLSMAYSLGLGFQSLEHGLRLQLGWRLKNCTDFIIINIIKYEKILLHIVRSSAGYITCDMGLSCFPPSSNHQKNVVLTSKSPLWLLVGNRRFTNTTNAPLVCHTFR